MAFPGPEKLLLLNMGAVGEVGLLPQPPGLNVATHLL
jgi:hypothetical protein